MVIRRMGRGVLLSCCVASATMVLGQTGGANGVGGRQNPPTFLVNTRIVLTDVTVTDGNGNPVAGLKEQDFRIFDDGRPEHLTSFEEHLQKADSDFESKVEPAGVYTNAAMLHPPAVVSAILIDTTTIGLVDQMYLYEQLTKFVQKLPAGEPVAIFCRAGQMTLLLQGFTSNHELLMKAIRKAIPHFQEPDAEYASGFDTLRQMAFYLSQVPGRKNILWFTSGSNLFLAEDPSNPLPPLYAQLRQETYDELEKERIAIYPIDARGLTVWNSHALIDQHMLMSEDAEATGGQAWYNTNGLAQAARHILATDGDYYTLAYSPDDLRDKGEWHRVAVKLREGAYRLSYRRGYYDDGGNGTAPPGETRTLLRAGGVTSQVPNDRSEPIPFVVRVVPASPEAEAALIAAGKLRKPKRGESAYAIIYDVPASALAPENVRSERATFDLGCAVLAFDQFGTPVVREAWKMNMTADERQLRSVPHGRVAFTANVNLPRGRNYLDVAVWDVTTGRMGTMNLSFDAKQPADAANAAKR
ncbi:MAG TPA: VWA domain-containing protein [Acidobacteriaceae bacterium]|nr:VWA domain-containing protein [Acidobacteriaceae bacterium]